MPRLSPLQTSFARGELSKQMRGRLDLAELLNAGADFLENWEPLPQGPLRLRAGSEYVAELNPDLGANPRIIPFRLAGRQDAIVALGDLGMRIYRADGGEVSTIGAELITTDGKPPWVDLAGTVDYAAGEYTYQSNEKAYRPVTTLEAGQHRIRLDFKAPGIGGLALQITVRLGTTQGGAEIGSWLFWSNSDAYNTYSATVNAVPLGTVYLSVQCQNIVGTYTAVVKSFSMRKVGSALPITTPWTTAQAAELQYASETGRDRMILVHPNVQPQVLTCFDGADDWLLQTLTQVGVVSQPGEWQGTNWPGVIEIHKGRSWWSGTPAERNKIWGSKSGAPFDFSQATPVVASDAIIQTLATKGSICWFKGQRHFLAGTEDGEHAFTAANGVLSQLDIDARDESAFGSATRRMALHAGKRVLYLSQDYRKIRTLGFALQEDGWVSKDLTYTAEHITEGDIDDMAFGKEPYGTIVARVNGELRLCNYDEGEKTIGWWRAKTSGAIISSTVTNGPDGSILWLAVSRANGVMLERWWMRERSDRKYLDSSVQKIASAAGVISGLGHLAGETVRAVILTRPVLGVATPVNAVTPTAQVSAGGELDLGEDAVGTDALGAAAGATVIVGLPYPGTRGAKAVTLPLEGREVPQGAKRRFAKVGLLLNDSALPIVNGDRASPDRTPATLQNTGEPRTTGKVRLVTLGWDDEGKIIIEQDLPLRTEILGVYGIASMNEA